MMPMKQPSGEPSGEKAHTFTASIRARRANTEPARRNPPQRGFGREDRLNAAALSRDLAERLRYAEEATGKRW